MNLESARTFDQQKDRSPAPAVEARSPGLFDGPGEMRKRCRSFDWSGTPLGSVSTWSQSLRTITSVLLASRHPMFLWWGPDLIQIFNDGYLPSFGGGGRDVAALGARGRDHWAEIWSIIGPDVDAVMERGEATWHHDHLVPITRNGHLEDVYWTYGYSPVRDDDGRIGGVLVVVQETTERVATLAERERLLALAEGARAEAERANMAKSDFLAMMSHELRTPLSAIAGHADLLELGVHGALLPDQAKALSRIKLSQQHLLSVINGILSFARVEAGAVEFEIEDMGLAEVLASAEALLLPKMLAKELHFSCPAQDPPLRVRADREKVHQIVLNLLSNAVKFTDQSGHITVASKARDDGTIEVSVTDTGPGIAHDQLERVFEPFVQLHAGHARSHDGTGLGLAISRQLARGMGGDVVAVSTAGICSKFTLILPGIA